MAPYAIDPEQPIEYILTCDRNLDPDAENRTVFDIKVLDDSEIDTIMRYINIANRYFKKKGVSPQQNDQFVNSVIEIGIVGWEKFMIEEGATINFSVENMKYLRMSNKVELCQAVLSSNELSLED